MQRERVTYLSLMLIVEPYENDFDSFASRLALYFFFTSKYLQEGFSLRLERQCGKIEKCLMTPQHLANLWSFIFILAHSFWSMMF